MTVYFPLRGNSAGHGDSVLMNQEMAARDGFRNVSQSWFETTRSFDDVLEEVSRNKDNREDLFLRLQDIQLECRSGRMRVVLRSGRILIPDNYGAVTLGQFAGVPAAYVTKLYGGRTEEDGEMLMWAIEHGLNELDQETEVILHLRNQPQSPNVSTLIAVQRSTNPVPNEWYLKVLQRAVPGGRLSHWRGDCDTRYGNVLIPDTIREEQDSEYGAMVSISNCEIGKRRLSQHPSLFRAICWNGCIWDQGKGARFAPGQKQAGDRNWLEREIQRNIHEQIAIADQCVRRLLATRSYRQLGTMKPVFAQVKQDLKLTKAEATAVLEAWHIEKRLTPDLSHTLFGVINAVTRAGQKLENARWVHFDELGGRLLVLTKDDWSDLCLRAGRLSVKEVETAFTAI